MDLLCDSVVVVVVVVVVLLLLLWEYLNVSCNGSQSLRNIYTVNPYSEDKLGLDYRL